MKVASATGAFLPRPIVHIDFVGERKTAITRRLRSLKKPEKPLNYIKRRLEHVNML